MRHRSSGTIGDLAEPAPKKPRAEWRPDPATIKTALNLIADRPQTYQSFSVAMGLGRQHTFILLATLRNRELILVLNRSTRLGGTARIYELSDAGWDELRV